MAQSHKVFCLKWRKFEISQFHYPGCNFKDIGVLGKKFKHYWKKRERSLCPHSQFGLLSISIQWSLTTCTICVSGCSGLLFGKSQVFPYKRKPEKSCQDSLFQSSPLDRQVGYGLHWLRFEQSQEASHNQAPRATQCTQSASRYKSTTLAAGNTNLALRCTPGTEKPEKTIMSHGNGVLHWTQGRMTPVLCSVDVATPSQTDGFSLQNSPQKWHRHRLLNSPNRGS